MIGFEQAVQKYGLIKNGIWQNEAQFCQRVVIPEHIADTWINSATGTPTHHIYCNKDIARQLLNALNRIYDRGYYQALNTFDGCFHIRDVRGVPGKISSHAYGLAIDINAGSNPLGGPARMHPEVVSAFEDAGFFWGDRFKRRDPMHFTFGW